MMGHPTCPPPLQQSPSRTLSHSVFMALPVGEISQRASISSWIIFCVFFFPRQWGNDGVVDAGRNGLCAGLVRSLVIRYCRSLCAAPGLANTPRDLSPIEVVKIQQQVAVQMIWSSMAKAMIDKSEMPGAASALCQGSGLEGLENNITIIIVIVTIVNCQYNHLCYHAPSLASWPCLCHM